MWLRLLVIGLVWGLLASCASPSYRQASLVVSDAHGGGHSLAITPDSLQLASGSWSGRISTWRLVDASRQHSWQAHDGDVTGLSYLGDARLLSAGYDGELREWTPWGQRVSRVATGSPVTAMSVDVTRQQVLTGHADGSLRLWSTSDLSRSETLGSHEGRIRAVAIAADGALFASSATDGTVRLWQRNGEVADLPKPWSDARTLVFSPQGGHLYGGGWFNLYRWDLPRMQLVTLDTDHRGIINSILFDPEGRYLASISRQTDSSVLSLDPKSGDTIRRFQSHKLCGGVVVISPDGRTLVTTSDDASVMIWRLEEAESAELRAAAR